MRPHVRLLTLAIAGLVAAACSSGTGPNNTGGSTGGHSTTITASSTTTGGAYGSGGNYYFSPTPDTVPAGTNMTYAFGGIGHNVTFAVAQAGAPTNIPTTMNASVQRMFSTPGTYVYHCTIHGISGTVVVQ